MYYALQLLGKFSPLQLAKLKVAAFNRVPKDAELQRILQSSVSSGTLLLNAARTCDYSRQMWHSNNFVMVPAVACND